MGTHSTSSLSGMRAVLGLLGLVALTGANPHHFWYGAGADGSRQGWKQLSSGGWAWKGFRFPAFKRTSFGGGGFPPISDIWTSTGTVPNKLKEVPPQLLKARLGPLKVLPNITFDTSQLQQRPFLAWQPDPNALYTVMIEDQDIGRIKYVHWMVTNIPGNNVPAGDEVLEYIPSFKVDRENGKLIKITPFQGGKSNRHLLLVYKQKGKIDVPTNKGCNKELIAPPRVNDHDKFQEANDLEGPVAATFYRVGYSPGFSEKYLCFYIKCTGNPFPGVDEDQAQCS